MEVVDVTGIMDSESEPLIKKKGGINSFEDALESSGFGLFHVLLIFVAGWALASDSVEVQCISFVTPQLASSKDDPSAKGSIVATDFQKGLLDAVIFLGMMVGGYFWGSWSDVVGRRSCLITSLLFNGTFGFASALAPEYYSFIFFRFMSGVGVGGSLPVAFSFFCEFFSARTRGPFVIVIAGFWILGSVFASLLALAIIDPLKERLKSTMWGSITIASWRVYILLCTLPALSAAFFLVFFPESPSFLFAKGKLHKAMNALNRVRRINSVSVYCYPPTRKSPLRYEELEAIRDKEDKPVSILAKVKTIAKTTMELFSWSYFRATTVLCFIWFTFSFGYYGLLLWFPEYFARVLKEQCNATASLTNSSCNSSDTSSSIYVDSVYTALAALPATVLGILTVNLLGGKIMLTSSILLCAVSSFLIRVVPPKEVNIVILSCLFNGIATFGWNALDIISTSDIFKVELRSSAFGIQAVFGRIGAMLGNIAFGQLISLDPMIPIAMVAALLLLGGLSAFILPSPPGESDLQRIRTLGRKCRHCLCFPMKVILNVQDK